MFVAVIIGGAFAAIVTALTNNIINLLISFIAGGNATTVSGLVVPGINIDFGLFISAYINFLIIGAVVFLIVKTVHTVQNLGKGLTKTIGINTKDEEIITTPPFCLYCLTAIPKGATRCPYCTLGFPSLLLRPVRSLRNSLIFGARAGVFSCTFLL